MSKIAEFKSITGADDSLAEYYLKENKDNLENAVNAFLNESHEEVSVKSPTKPTTKPTTQNVSPTSVQSPKRVKMDDIDDVKIDKSKLPEKYRACMVLSAVGDAIGYKNGKWEFNKNGLNILKEYYALGGITEINVDPKNWKVSDDTVMHLATAEALVDGTDNLYDLCKLLAKKYIECGKDMEGRAPGGATMNSLMLLEGILPFDGRKVTPLKWNETPFNEKGGGCGAAMRAMCIGLRFPGESNRSKLISVSLESGRITHNHPVAFFGAVAAAVFTAYAIEGVPMVKWGKLLVTKILPKAREYLKTNGRDWELYTSKSNFDYFENSWLKYLKLRGIWEDDATAPVFPSKFGPQERDQFYKDVSFDGWGGSSGHDAVIIAYDALLAAKDSWEELVLRAVLHGGDSDTTGCIGGALFGALYGFHKVPEGNYKNLEYRKRCEDLSQQLLIFSGLL